MNEGKEYEKREKRSTGQALKIFFVCIALAAILSVGYNGFAPAPFRPISSPTLEEQEKTPISAVPQTEELTQKEEIKTEPSPPQEQQEAIKPAELPAEKPLPTANDEKIKQLEEKVANLEEQIAAIKLAQSSQTSTIEQSIKNSAATLALEQLKEKILSGAPFAEEMTRLQNLLLENQQATDTLANLSSYATSGIGTEAELIKQFPTLAKSVIQAASNGWIRQNAEKFVSIRKVGEQEGKDDEAILARAENRLITTPISLYQASKELEKLSPQGQQVFKDWLENAAKIQMAKGSIERLRFIITASQANKPNTQAEK